MDGFMVAADVSNLNQNLQKCHSDVRNIRYHYIYVSFDPEAMNWYDTHRECQRERRKSTLK